MNSTAQSPGYQFFMLVLSVYALVVVGAQMSIDLLPEVATLLDYSDVAICALFFADFLVSLYTAPDRWAYLRRWGWLDLLSSLPMLDAARWGRAARIVRILRVLRGLRATKVLTGAILRRRAENGVVAALLAAIILTTLCSAAVLQVETAPESNIKTAEDAAWWALTTMTTVGYGDRFPVTTEGRAIAAVLMIAGVDLFTTFSGLLAAWFMQPARTSQDEVARLREQIASLQAQINRQNKGTPP